MNFDREIYKYRQQTITKKALNYCDFTVCLILLYLSLHRQVDKREAWNTILVKDKSIEWISTSQFPTDLYRIWVGDIAVIHVAALENEKAQEKGQSINSGNIN